ncbi:uncharacterized protein LOC143057452 [Mytilus galloprovincialis]|uniref:uncharacterized protein LOC143057452 n=1 Tax=Mytilus galloprovincialis TaxID=29158 RepID=UPI003F7C44D8
MEIPLSIVLLLLFGVTFLTCTTMACGATTCTSCTTTVQTTCPTMQAPCRPDAACPAGFTTVANGNSNKCYLVGSADVANFAAASIRSFQGPNFQLSHLRVWS